VKIIETQTILNVEWEFLANSPNPPNWKEWFLKSPCETKEIPSQYVIVYQSLPHELHWKKVIPIFHDRTGNLCIQTKIFKIKSNSIESFELFRISTSLKFSISTSKHTLKVCRLLSILDILYIGRVTLVQSMLPSVLGYNNLQAMIWWFLNLFVMTPKRICINCWNFNSIITNHLINKKRYKINQVN